MDSSIISDSDGIPRHSIISLEDITELREKEAAYRKWQQLYRGTDAERIMCYEFNVNKDFCELEEGRLLSASVIPVGGCFSEIIKEVARKSIAEESQAPFISFFKCERLAMLQKKGRCSDSGEFIALTKNGRRIWIRASLELLEYPYSTDVKAYAVLENIDEVRKSELSIRERLQKDSLTSVLNRSSFIEALDGLLRSSKSFEKHAVIMLDLDHFKQINDSYGHIAGDELLKDAAARVRSVLRSSDMIGRIGGDEFMICLKNIPYEEIVTDRLKIICGLMRIKTSDGPSVSASLGVAFYPRDGRNFHELYEKADCALYKAKRGGGDRFTMYNSSTVSLHYQLCAPEPPEFSCGNEKELLSQDAVVERRDNFLEVLKSILKKTGTLIFEWKNGLGVTCCSEQLKDYTAFSNGRDFMEAFLVSDFSGIHAEDVPLLREKLGSFLYGDSECMEIILRLLDKNGEYKWAGVIFIAEKGLDNTIERVLGVLNFPDTIHDRLCFQLDALVNYVPAGLMLLDATEGEKPLYVSPSFYKLSNVTRDEYSQNRRKFLMNVMPESRRLVEQTLQTAGFSAEGEAECIYRVAGKSGELKLRSIKLVRTPYGTRERPLLAAAVTNLVQPHHNFIMMKKNLDTLNVALSICEYNGFLSELYSNRRFLRLVRDNRITQEVMNRCAQQLRAGKSGKRLFEFAPGFGRPGKTITFEMEIIRLGKSETGVQLIMLLIE